MLGTALTAKLADATATTQTPVDLIDLMEVKMLCLHRQQVFTPSASMEYVWTRLVFCWFS